MRKRKEDYKSYNGGGLGYSQDALDALMAGKYREFSGNRQAKYNTSQEQTQQANSLPVLKGVSIPSNDAWESNFSKNKSHIDIDRARRKYAENYNQSSENLQTNDENYVVKRDRYNKLMKNSRLANDIKTLAMVNYNNANQDATVSQEWADEYGAKAITGGLSKSQFLTQLSKRYELTPEELNDMALTFHSDANKQDVADYGKQLEEIGKNHELIGSAGSLVGTLGSGFEGMYNAGVGALTGDDRYLSNIFSTTKKAPREGVKQNIKTDFGKGAYDIGMGIADMAAGAAAGSAPVILAGNTANEAQESARERGTSTRKASLYGVGAGALDYVTNKIGLDKAKKLAVDSIKSTGIKKFLAQNAIAGLGEAGENVLQDLGQSFIDALVNGENSELSKSYSDKVASGMSESDAFKETAKEYAAQLGFSGALGFGMGSAMQAGATAIPKVPELARNYKEKNQSLGAMDESFRRFIADGLKGDSVNIDGTDYSVDRTNNNLVDANGKEVPIIDPSVFDTSKRGTPEQTKRQFAAQLTKYIKDNFVGKSFTVKDNGRSIGFIGESADEFASSNSSYRKSNEKMGLKANIAPRLQSVIENALFNHHENNTKSYTPMKDRGMDKYDITIAYPTENGIELYDAVMDVGLHQDGNDYFFDILEIEPKKKADTQLLSNDSVTDISRPSFENNIPQNGENVNRTMNEAATGNPRVTSEIPLTDVNNAPSDGGDKVRSFSKRGSYDETLPDEIRNTLSEDYYKVVHNADTEARANDMFVPDDLIQTRSNLDRAVESHDPASALLSYKLAKAYVDNGNYDAATDVLQNVSAELTRMGQFTQAAKLAMLQNDPMAALRSYMRDLEKLNQWGREKYKGKWKNLELSEEDIDTINKIQKGDKEALNAAIDSLNEKFSKQIPSNWWDKTVSATKTAMLLNPRTQFRNVLANMATLPLRSASDRVAALGQNIAHLINDDVKVTQSVLGGTKEQKNIAAQVFDRLKDEITGENKMKDSVKSDILSQRQIFNDDFLGKWIDNLTNGGVQRLNEKFGANGNQSTMETLQNLTYWLMGDVGDTPFVKKNFVNRLASYMKAQDINNVDDIPDEAISIATQEALKATFKDDNAFTKALQGIKQKSGKFGEVALPFVKTPANLTMRAIDYSPAGLINTFRKIRSNADANAVIDDLSKNLTGTALIYLGYKLAEKGLLSGSYSSDADEAAFQKQQGMLENAIHIGDNYYTYDWTQPASTPLVLGQTIYEAIKASDHENANIKDIVNATYKGGLKVANTIINSSPLQSLSDLLGDNPYGEEGVAENFANELLEFPQRFIPSVLGATARTIDPVMRDTYIKDSTLTGALGNQARQAMAKVPFLSRTLPASYDTWGNKRTRSDSKGEAFFAQMVNPGQLGNKNATPLDDEIQRLYESTGDNAVFPLYAARSLNLGSDGNITLTNKEHSDYQKKMGQRSYSYAESLMNNEDFKNLDDGDKVNLLAKAYKLSNDLTKEEMFDHVTDSDKNLKEVARNGKPEDVAKYLLDSAKAKSLGMNMSQYQKAEANGGAEELAQKKQAAADAGVVKKDGTVDTEHYNKVLDRAGTQSDRMANDFPALKELGLSKSADYVYANAIKVNPNITIPEFSATYNEIDTNKKDKLTQKEMLDYINKYQFSDDPNEDLQMVTELWKTYQDGTWKKVPYLKKDGSYGIH